MKSPIVPTASRWARTIESPPAGDAAGPDDARPGAAPAPRIVGTVAVLLLADMVPASRSWAWSRLAFGGWPLRGTPGLGFVKVLGSGAGGGFGVRPSATHQGLFLVFDDEPAARRFLAESPVAAAYRARARELCVAVLRATSSKGSWSGAAMQPTARPTENGPIAALTRASIRPQHAREFWRLSPATERALAAAPGCQLAAGLGEAPYLRQATFSLWSNVQAMDAYARSGAHAEAIRRAYRGEFFSETMFVRFLPLEVSGIWQGRTHG